MPANADLEVLQEADKALKNAKETRNVDAIEQTIKYWGQKIGWKNAAHMYYGISTPEKLKGI